ncbi:hypothetical protein [Halegenticoccus tardaugens]|uniref:hypothetical protein n=1 Tax=Halegenticoccus tardaugens TaxID=2071624 RepID=UPI001E5033EC|nr:hypothetical protein [Halegenticoccus tardaugens]
MSDRTADAGETRDAEGRTPRTADEPFAGRIRALAAAARREREAFVPPTDPPSEERALSYLRAGLGPTVSLYLEARTGDRYAAFAPEELALLGRATNDWLSLYARCYGVDFDPDFTVREVAELVVRTHDLRDTAQLLTRVPDR